MVADETEDELYGLDDVHDQLLFRAIVEAWEDTQQADGRSATTKIVDGFVNADISTSKGVLGQVLSDSSASPDSRVLLTDLLESDHSKVTSEDIRSLEVERETIGLSPFKRFRSGLNRLSVTDLVSPAWCEVQFQYDLEKGGKRRRTKAMQIGHEVHSTLEKEVHATVLVDLDPEIPEEKFGLRLLNVLTGLAELERGDITREFPVMGFLNGVFVTGVVDQLERKGEPVQSNEQDLMAKFLKRPVSTNSANIFLSDHKTRVTKSEPSKSQVDQTKLQLMIYWKLLSDMPSMDLNQVLARESFRPDQAFSDNFLRQMLQSAGATQDVEVHDMLTYNNITRLWSLVVPRLERVRRQLSSTLMINYLHQGSGKHIAAKSFELDQSWMQERLTSIVAWWDGRRQARGVPVEEAYKCSFCQFEEGCTWRLGKVREGIEKHRVQARQLKTPTETH